MASLHLFIKPASGNCNLHCKYCFYTDVTSLRDISSYGIMSTDTLEHIVRKAFDYATDECTFSFQGGEPTLAGLSFYERLMELCAIYNTEVCNGRTTPLKLHFAIQTNGYRLTEEWAAFFARHHFLVGISLDGTIHTHNAFRRTADGKDTFADIMRTIELFKKYNVEFNILTVVNKKTAASIDKIYHFYQKNHFEYLQFIPCLDPFKTAPGSQEYSLTPKEYGDFLCRLFDLWYTDFKAGQGISIRQFDNYLSLILYGYAEACDMNGVCSMQNVIEADGSVYPCDFFVLDEYRLGNLNEMDFPAINEKRKELRFIEKSAVKPDSCMHCPHYTLCRGGCMRYRVMNSHALTAFRLSATEHSASEATENIPTNYFCQSYRQFFDYTLPRLQELAALVARVM
ncbi:MAG: anaerobic sulfatase maturase [Lachnospiraceae bacterium]|nr:anaerobic sulfatase maturase [Lachnospiraceae bacterium]